MFDEFCLWYAAARNPDYKHEFTTDAPKAKAAGARSKGPQAKAAAAGPRDDHPDIEGHEYDDLEQTIQALAKDPAALAAEWRSLDFNGNGKVSLAEIDKYVVERYPLLNHKPALMRAYKVFEITYETDRAEEEQSATEERTATEIITDVWATFTSQRTISREGGGDGDDWVGMRKSLQQHRRNKKKKIGEEQSRILLISLTFAQFLGSL